eukprot:3131739-Pyramimonas_sp.AAC.1
MEALSVGATALLIGATGPILPAALLEGCAHASLLFLVFPAESPPTWDRRIGAEVEVGTSDRSGRTTGASTNKRVLRYVNAARARLHSCRAGLRLRQLFESSPHSQHERCA